MRAAPVRRRAGIATLRCDRGPRSRRSTADHDRDRKLTHVHRARWVPRATCPRRSPADVRPMRLEDRLLAKNRGRTALWIRHLRPCRCWSCLQPHRLRPCRPSFRHRQYSGRTRALGRARLPKIGRFPTSLDQPEQQRDRDPRHSRHGFTIHSFVEHEVGLELCCKGNDGCSRTSS